MRSRERTGAVVIGAGYSGLGVVRSLGRRGIPVLVMAEELGAASASRFAWRILPWPLDQQSRLKFLLDVGASLGLDGWVLYPTDDQSVSLLARNHRVLSRRYRLFTPPWNTVRVVHDKWLLHELAAELGIDQPWAFHPRDRKDLSALERSFPVILKPTLKERTNHFTFARAWLAGNRDVLLSRYDEACRMVSPDSIMVQEYIPGLGNDFAFGALAVEGRPAASVVVRRPRQHPLGFGRASTYVETADLPEVEAAGRRLVDALRITGLVHVGFKRDPRDGRYKLLDVNPRVWSSHTLGRQGGVDFAYLQWRLAHGQPLPVDLRTPPGLRWIRLVTDLFVSTRLILKGELSIPEYLRSFRSPVELAAFAWDDPLPAVAGLPVIRRRKWTQSALQRAHEEAASEASAWRSREHA